MQNLRQTQRSVRVVVFVAIVALICVSVALQLRETPVEASTTRNESEYLKIATASRLVLFLHAAASIESNQKLPQFNELARQMSRSEPPIMFVIIDFSNELMTPFWHRMNDWFDEQKVDTLGYRGYGKILWVSKGHVLDWLPPNQQLNVKDLVTTTYELFAPNNTFK